MIYYLLIGLVVNITLHWYLKDDMGPTFKLLKRPVVAFIYLLIITALWLPLYTFWLLGGEIEVKK